MFFAQRKNCFFADVLLTIKSQPNVIKKSDNSQRKLRKERKTGKTESQETFSKYFVIGGSMISYYVMVTIDKQFSDYVKVDFTLRFGQNVIERVNVASTMCRSITIVL